MLNVESVSATDWLSPIGNALPVGVGVIDGGRLGPRSGTGICLPNHHRRLNTFVPCTRREDVS
jgi:hypothetical protein